MTELKLNKNGKLAEKPALRLADKPNKQNTGWSPSAWRGGKKSDKR